MKNISHLMGLATNFISVAMVTLGTSLRPHWTNLPEASDVCYELKEQKKKTRSIYRT